MKKKLKVLKKAQETYNKAMAQLSQEFSSKTDSVKFEKRKEDSRVS